VADADPETIAVGSTKIYLDNIYRHVRNLPSARRDDEIAAVIERGMAGSATPNDNVGVAAAGDRLRPQIVPADYLKTARGLVHRPFLAYLIVAYALDEKDGINCSRSRSSIPGMSGVPRSRRARSSTWRRARPAFN